MAERVGADVGVTSCRSEPSPVLAVPPWFLAGSSLVPRWFLAGFSADVSNASRLLGHYFPARLDDTSPTHARTQAIDESPYAVDPNSDLFKEQQRLKEEELKAKALLPSSTAEAAEAKQRAKL